MTKVTIPNDVADAIETLRASHTSNARIVELATNGGIGPSSKLLWRYTHGNDANFDTLMSALINGYEREQTAEERAHEHLRSRLSAVRAASNPYNWTHGDGYKRGMIDTLDVLGVKVAGVNV